VSKTLIIVESPAKARTIEKHLGARKYAVRASMGHVRDLPKSQLGVEVGDGFAPKYITIRGKGEILKDLRESAKKASRVLLATDPDREGEAISWHLSQVLGLDEASLCRIEFHEITKDAITRAVKKPRQIDASLVEAQQARRILDRLVGYKLSPLLWRKVRRGLSAGRVQSVAVRLIVDREQEIEAFRPEEYWTLTARLRTEKGLFAARYYGVQTAASDRPSPEHGAEQAGDRNGDRNGTGRVELKSEEEARRVMAEVLGLTALPDLAVEPGLLEPVRFLVQSVKRREKRRNPAPAFITSSLQQEASRKLGFSVRRTMSVAQQLYEGLDLGEAGPTGLVTYIRTDSTRIAQEAQEAAAAYVREQYGAEYLPEQRREAETRPGEQGAHEAIRPTDVIRTPDSIKTYLSPDQYRLYKLIWERFVASQMAAAVLDIVTVEIGAGGHLFRASGSTVKFRGFMRLYIEGEDDDGRKEEEEGLLPEMAEGQLLRLDQLEPRQHFTQPPPRYSEAMLVRALEERRIGRPSTYAPIIETIQQRGYVQRAEKRFVPTELGRRVVEILTEYFPEIVDVEFTARMEGELDEIEEGKQRWRAVLEEFYGPFESTLKEAEEKIGGFELQDEVSEVICDLCGRQMVIKYGRFGKFLACPGFPECKRTKPLLEETGVACPTCRDGMLVERKSKKGRKFYGCSRYPECDYVSWYKPVQRPCPDCGSLLVERKTKEHGHAVVCTAEECGYLEPVEELEEVTP
jgi:DNA topoisomerase I